MAIIDYVEKFLIEFVASDIEIIFGKLSFDSHGLILRSDLKESYKVLDDLVMRLEHKVLKLGTKTYYPQLIVGLTSMTPENPSYEIATLVFTMFKVI